MAGGAVHPFSGFTLSICQLRPESRGRVAIRSPDPMQPPSMQPNYLATEHRSPHDRRRHAGGARDRAVDRRCGPSCEREVKPGPGGDRRRSAARVRAQQRRDHLPPVGTCKMGNDADGGRRRAPARARHRPPAGGRLLDHADAGVSGNTNAPVMMIAEKAVDMIRADALR